MKLSVIAITYNSHKGLIDTIKSVEAQSMKDLEWLFMNGSSTDGSRKLLEERYESFTSGVSEPDIGIYNPMNKGIKMSHGGNLLFLNSGYALATNNMIENSFSHLSNADFVIGRTYHYYNISVKNVCENDFKMDNLAYWFIVHSLPHQGSFMRRSLFDEFGSYRVYLQTISDWVFMHDSIAHWKAKVNYLSLLVPLYDDNCVIFTNKIYII